MSETEQQRIGGDNVDKLLFDEEKINYNGKVFTNKISDTTHLIKLSINQLTDADIEEFEEIIINNTRKRIEVDGKKIEGQQGSNLGFMIRIALQGLKGERKKTESRDYMYEQMVGDRVTEGVKITR